jgi:hypothetical protein
MYDKYAVATQNWRNISVYASRLAEDHENPCRDGWVKKLSDTY